MTKRKDCERKKSYCADNYVQTPDRDCFHKSFERLPWMMTCEDWLIFPPFTRSLGYATLISFPYLLGLGVRGGDRRSTTAENADGHQGSCLTVPLGP
ncbi:uncharacterized [Tachysurus ichikawai]